MAHASGKVILCGEHAVVYGVPAIAAGISKGASAHAQRSERPEIRVGDRNFEADAEICIAYQRLLQSLGAPPCSTQVDLALVAGSGLGASAAIAVATARAVLDALGDEQDRDARVLTAAGAFEEVFHGTPSGIDTAAAASAGCIWYVRGEPPARIPLGAPLVLAVGIAGPPASTKKMVASVRALKERRPNVVQKALDGIEALAKNAKLCLEAGDTEGLGKLMDLNQMLLAGLHVSSEEIEVACGIARDAGALGAKLTGAGGGGAVIALVQESAAAVIAAWKAQKIPGFEAQVPGPSA